MNEIAVLALFFAVILGIAAIMVRRINRKHDLD
jgi:hypothetical protein